MFDKIIELAGDNESLISEINSIKDNYSKLKDRADKSDNLVSKLKVEKSGSKDVISHFKNILKIEGNEELSKEAINAKFETIKTKFQKTGSKKEQDLLDQISNIENVMKEKGVDYDTKLSKLNDQLIDKSIEIELFNATQEIDAENKFTAKIIRDRLKEGFSYEDGTGVYRNEEGSILKGSDGLTNKTPSDKLAEMKLDEELSVLFKDKKKGGSGIDVNNKGNGENPEGLSELQLKLRARRA